MKLNTKILNNKYLTHIVIIVLLLIIIVLIYVNYFMGSKKYREFFDEHNIDKLKDMDYIKNNTNECKSNTCKDMQDSELRDCMNNCCRDTDCKDKDKELIKDGNKTLSYSEFNSCMTTCTDP